MLTRSPLPNSLQRVIGLRLLLHPIIAYLHSCKTVSTSKSWFIIHSFEPREYGAISVLTIIQSAVVGFTRSFGKYLPRENITLNTICPTIVATGISTGTFYQQAEEKGLLVTLDALMDAFDYVMTSDVSGEAIEILPGGDGHAIKEGPKFTDEKCKQSIELARAPEHRAWKFHECLE